MRKEEKILLRSDKSASEILAALKKSTKEYNIVNIITSGEFVLYKNRGNKIILDIPRELLQKKIGMRKFYGEVYEQDGHAYIEGSFEISRIPFVFYSILWGFMGIVSVLGLGGCLVQACMMREWRIVWFCLFLWGGEVCMFTYWLWSVFGYRNTRNELRIIEALWKSCK